MRHCKRSHQPFLPTLRASRGFAVLLYSYLVVAFLLTFSASTLMMSSLDARHAARALTQQQAFWAAEGELEAAIVQIQATTPPSLSDGQCVAYTSRTLSSASSISSSANLCGEKVASSLYRLDSTGIAKTTTDRLSIIVSFASRPTFRFQYLSYALCGSYTQDGATTGSMDSRNNRLLVASSFNNYDGTVAVPQNSGGCNGDYTSYRIKPMHQGWIYGNALVKTGASFSSPIYGQHTGGQIFGTKAYLPSIPTLPEVDIPREATSLGSELRLVQDERRCLAPGIYKADRIYLSERAELCTTGKVELYLTGTGTSSWPEVVYTKPDSKLYGQPAGSSPYAQQYSPQDLLIVVKNGLFATVQSSRTAAAIYAPNTNVRVWPSDSSSYGVFFGAVVGDEVVNIGRLTACSDNWSCTTGQRSYIIYDRALAEIDMPIGRRSGSGSGSGVTILGWVDP